jgi:hypothetical protein
MGLVDDIIDRMQEIVSSVGDTLVDNAIELVTKVIISGLTITLAAPGVELAKYYNRRVGWVDPLLLPPLQVYPYGDLLVTHGGEIITQTLEAIPYTGPSGLPSDILDVISIGDLGGLDTIWGYTGFLLPSTTGTDQGGPHA